MKTQKQGSVLIITLGTLVIAAILVGIVMNASMNVAKATDRSRKYAAAQSATDGALEYAYAIWLKRTNNKHRKLYTTSDLAITGPSFSGSDAPAGSGTAGLSYASGWNLTIQPLNSYGVATTGTAPEGVIGSVPNYPGWWGMTYTYAATARMQPTGDPSISAGVRRLFYYTEVPMFQTMYFFNDDLEIYNPAPIALSGLIHSNKALYFSVNNSTDFKINSRVTTAGAASVYTAGDPSGTVPGYSTAQPPLSVGSNYDKGTLNDPTWNVAMGGITSQLNQVAPIQPLGTALDALFLADKNATTHNPNLVNGYHELLEPPNTTDLTANPDPIAESRLFNKAGLIIKISGTTRSGTTTTTVTTPGSIKIKPYTSADVAITTTTVDSTTKETTLTPIAGFPILVAANNGATLPVYDSTKTAANQTAAYKSAIANIAAAMTKQLATDATNGLTTMYDQRVSANVNVTNVDVGALGTVISSNVTGNFNGVVYIQDATLVGTAPADGVTSDGTYNNTVRLVNGKVLPADGLTIASPNPVYIQGDYNTGYGAPSTANPATVDVSTNTAYGSLSSKNTGNTTSGGSTPYTRSVSAVVGDAVMLLSNAWNDLYSPAAKYSNRTAATTTYNTAIMGGYMPSQSGSFSGGAINYPRFLENWNNVGCVYWGSMVQLFASKTCAQLWQAPGNYYNPPNRYFNFDPLFAQMPPPGSVSAVVLSRGPWTRF